MGKGRIETTDERQREMTSSNPVPPGPEQVLPVNGPESAPKAGSAATTGLVRLTDLLGPRREISILHGEAVYTLRLTSNNRLILTK